MSIRLLPRPLHAVPLLAAALLLSACGGGGQAQRTTFDLTAPGDVGRTAGGRAQIVVNEPTALQALDTDRVLVNDGGALAYLPDAQWSDRLLRLFQVRLIQTFENASRLGRVSRPGERVTADYLLNVDIRGFGVDARASAASVEVTARLINDRDGRVAAAQVFRAQIPLGSTAGPQATAALDLALAQVLRDIVRWAGRF